MKGYRHRRLRSRPVPQYLLRVPHVSPEDAKRLRDEWRKAAHHNPIVVSSNIEVVRLR